MTPATSDAEVEALAVRAESEGPLSPAEAARLCAGDVLTLGELADGARRRLHGEDATLVRTLVLGWGEDPAALAPSEAADEVRFSGDVPAGATAADLCATLARAAAARPGVPLRAVRPAEVPALAGAAGLTDRLLLARLADAGLSTLAHPLPGDDPAATREGLLAAHGADLATDAPIRYGTRFTPAGLAALLLAYRDLPGAAERFRCGVPLPASAPEESPLTATTGLEDLRVFACARLLLPGALRIAAEAELLGPKLAAVALSFGADTLAGALALPTERTTPQTAERPRPFNADRARLLLAEAGRAPRTPPPFPGRLP